VSYGVTDGTVAVDRVLSFGACTGVSNRWAVGNYDEDNQASSDSLGWYATDEVVQIFDPSDASLEAEADFSAWTSNGVTINWASAPDAAYLMTVVFFAGTDLSAYADGEINLGNTTDLETDITGPGFQPDIVIAGMCLGVNNPGTISHGRNSFGFVHYDGVSTYTQRTITTVTEDSKATTEVDSALRNDAIVVEISSAAAFDWWGEAGGFDSSGFSVWSRNNGANQRDLNYLALSFGGAVDSWIGTHTTPTSTGNDSETGPSFTPQFVLMITSLMEAHNTAYDDGRAGTIGLSVFDANDEYSTVVSAEDASATSDSQSLSDDRAIVIPDDDGTLDIEATFVSFDANGWTVNYSNAPSTAKLLPALAIEEYTAAAGQPMMLRATTVPGMRQWTPRV
jgi:hypothetical protein